MTLLPMSMLAQYDDESSDTFYRLIGDLSPQKNRNLLLISTTVFSEKKTIDINKKMLIAMIVFKQIQ